MTFSEMNLVPEISKALVELNFEKPTPVQTEVLPLALNGEDIMVCAETGSGKTGSYGIPLVKHLIENEQERGLVLAPTRELVFQIADFLRDLTKHCKGIQVASLVGGADMRKQLKSLKKNPRLIVATPGRLLDHINRRSVSLKYTKTLVLDEGDRMLDMGFAPQLEDILEHLPEERRTSLFTATLPKKVSELARKYLTDPRSIQVGRGSLPVEAIKQSIIQVPIKKKKHRLIDELNEREGHVVIFFRTKSRTDMISEFLDDYGFKVEVIHGDKTQGSRNRAIQKFKQNKVRILCATDIAARGLDIPQVEHVINFDLPRVREDYVHRIGRTARNGAEGEAVSFVAPEDAREWNYIAKRFKVPAGAVPEPTSSDEGGRRRGRGDKKFSQKKGRSFFQKKRSGGDRDTERSSRFGDEKFGDKKFGDKKFGDKKFGDKKFGDKKFGDKKFGDKKFGDKKFGDKKFGDKKFGDKKFGDKSEFRSSRRRPFRSDEMSDDNSKGFRSTRRGPNGEERRGFKHKREDDFQFKRKRFGASSEEQPQEQFERKKSSESRKFGDKKKTASSFRSKTSGKKSYGEKSKRSFTGNSASKRTKRKPPQK